MRWRGLKTKTQSSMVSESALHPPEERVTLAVIQRPRGLRGEVVAFMLTDFPERFEKLQNVWLTSEAGDVRPAQLETTWFHKGSLILKFQGLDSRTQVEPFAGYKVQIPLAERVALEEDEFFIDMLVGCRVELPDASCLGEVVSVASMGGGDMLVIRPTAARSSQSETEYLVPFVRSICPEVDLVGKRIRITPPEGLLETQKAEGRMEHF